MSYLVKLPSYLSIGCCGNRYSKLNFMLLKSHPLFSFGLRSADLKESFRQPEWRKAKPQAELYSFSASCPGRALGLLTSWGWQKRNGWTSTTFHSYFRGRMVVISRTVGNSHCCSEFLEKWSGFSMYPLKTYKSTFLPSPSNGHQNRRGQPRTGVWLSVLVGWG